MADRSKLPSILVLRSIRPEAAGGGRLVSPRIDRAVASYVGHEDKIREFLARSRPGSLDEEEARRALEKASGATC